MLSAFLPTNKDRQKFAKTSYKRIVILLERLYNSTESLYEKMEGTITDDFMMTKEVAELWNISVRQIQNHCKNGHIIGVLKVSANYLIPRDAIKPKYTYVYQANDNSESN